MQSVFIHSFPRPDAQCPLTTLDFILKYGLLLTPEIISIQSEDDSCPSTVRRGKALALQRRFCLTLLDDDLTHLLEHGNKFGKFHIQLSFEDTRKKLGAIPVFYVANSFKGQLDFDAIGYTLIHRLADVQYILYYLDEIETFVNDTSCENEHFQFRDTLNANLWFQRKELDALLKEIMKKNQTNVSMKDLKNWMKYLSNFFVPTEYKGEEIDICNINSKHPYLEYYNQNEWRILGDMALDEKPLARALESSEKSDFLRLNHSFFSESLKKGKEKPIRIDECRIINQTIDKQPVRELIEKVYVPKSDKPEVYEILEKYGMTDCLHEYEIKTFQKIIIT